MPFRNQEWEDLQRDCDIFPAYTDYIYGPDERLVVTQEPGLHPMIYHIDSSAPIRYTNSMPSRSWSYKTAEGLKTPKNGATRGLAPGQDETSNDNTSIVSNGSSTPGLDIRSQVGSPLQPLLPPQGVRTVSKKEIARNETLNAPQGQTQLARELPFSPLQQQQPVRSTRQQKRMSNAPINHRPGSRPQQPHLLRSSSTTDLDENLAHVIPRHESAMLLPHSSQAAMLPLPASLPQQQSQRATGMSNHSSSPPASNTFPGPSIRAPFLRPNDILQDPRYNCLDSNKRMEIAKGLFERGTIARDSPDLALRAKALLDIQNVTMMVQQSIANIQAVKTLQKHGAQRLQTQREIQAQTRQVHQVQQYQQVPQVPQLYAQTQLQPGVSPFQSSQPSPNQHYSIPHTSRQQIQPPQPLAPQGYQESYQPQPQSYTQSPSQQRYQQAQHDQNADANATPVPPQASAQLRANINRHIPHVWHCLKITRGTSGTLSEEAAQQRQRAGQWLGQFRMSLPNEGRTYLTQVAQRMMFEHNQGKDPLVSLGIQARPE